MLFILNGSSGWKYIIILFYVYTVVLKLRRSHHVNQTDAVTVFIIGFLWGLWVAPDTGWAAGARLGIFLTMRSGAQLQSHTYKKLSYTGSTESKEKTKRKFLFYKGYNV